MNPFLIFIKEKMADLSGYCYYNLLNNKYYSDMPRSVKISVEIDSKTKQLLAFSPEYNGLYTVVSKHDELDDMVNDAIYTYFGVPRFIAKQLPNLFFPEGTGKTYNFVSNKTVVVA